MRRGEGSFVAFAPLTVVSTLPIQLLDNITVVPNKQEPSLNGNTTTDQQLLRHTFSPDVTSSFIKACKDHNVTVTVAMNAIQALSVMTISPPADATRRNGALNCVSNRMIKTTMYNPADGKDAAKKASIRAYAAGPVMATNFVVVPFDLGSFVDAKTSSGEAWKSSFWKVAESIKEGFAQYSSQDAPEKAYWTSGPTGFGLLPIALPAMKAGAAPVYVLLWRKCVCVWSFDGLD